MIRLGYVVGDGVLRTSGMGTGRGRGEYVVVKTCLVDTECHRPGTSRDRASRRAYPAVGRPMGPVASRSRPCQKFLLLPVV